MPASGQSAITVAGNPWPKWQIMVALGVPVAVGGLGYYLYSRSALQSAGVKGQKEDEATKKVQQVSLDEDSSSGPVPSKNAEGKKQQGPLERSQMAKNKGNKYFRAGKYDQAIECYNEAINICPETENFDLATFYQNRAAAYEQKKDYEAVIQDCTSALSLHPRYIKALQRRAKACEATKKLSLSLQDITAACILEQFQNQTTLFAADRILRQLGQEEARNLMVGREPVMPSNSFVRSYFTSFAEDEITKDLFSKTDQAESNTNISRPFLRAKQALRRFNLKEVVPACTEEIVQQSSNAIEARLLRGSFHLLLGKQDLALEDFNSVIEDNSANTKIRVNALIKRAALFMQQELPEKCFNDFDAALELDEKNADIYHHRGQIYLLIEEFEKAYKDLERSLSLRPDIAVVCAQKLLAKHRMAFVSKEVSKMNEVQQEFREALTRYPNSADCFSLYGQILHDSQDFEQADDCFKKAIAIDPTNASLYVHRGMTTLQWKGEIEDATKLIRKALEVDQNCEFAYETLGTIEVQRGNHAEAIKLFEKAIPLAKTEVELAHLCSLSNAAKAQKTVAESLGQTPIPPLRI